MNKKSLFFYEIFGWVGTALILIAYALVSIGWIGAETVLYQLMNIIGATGVLCIAYIKKVYQTVTIESIWIIIGVVALIKLLF